MKKWNVSIPLNATAYFEIEAESEEEAIQQAYDIGTPALCHQCANEVDVGDFAFDGDAIAEEI